jgi:hypothetical protein
MALGTVLTFLHFLHNLKIGPISKSVNTLVCQKGLPGTNTVLTRPSCKLGRKWTDVNSALGAVFTTLHFFHNLQIGPNKSSSVNMEV